MSQKERKEIIKSFEIVDEVVITEHKINDNDKSVCRELEKLNRIYLLMAAIAKGKRYPRSCHMQ